MAWGRGRPAAPPGVRSGSVLLAATVLALSSLLVPARAPAAVAAADGLTLTTSATYTIVPARQVVRVVIDLTARNDKPNVTAGGNITRYFYEGARLAIQAEATNVRATAGGKRLTVTVSPKDGFAIMEVRFRSPIFFHQSTTTKITFDLPGGAPRSTSDIRVGTAFATFVAWAFGDSGSVRINVPAGFDAETTGSTVVRTTSGTTTVLRAASIGDPANWYVVVMADRESALTRERVDLAGGEHVVIRGWPEDDEWRSQVKDLLVTGLPELVAQTGLEWPVAGDLSIFEVHTPLLEGYAGVFLVGQDRIEISEDLDDLTILHEASHAWFNGGLFQGRWINEGFADTYGARALVGLGIGGWAPKTVDPTDKAAVRLMTWEHPGRIEDEETDAREQYGYEASWTVIRSLLLEIGDDGMRKVLAAAQIHQVPYIGAGAPEILRGPADWRRFLDLLEEVGGSKTATDVFRRWVVTDAQTGILDKRSAARAAWSTLKTAGGDWLAPYAVRGPLSSWDFVTATLRMSEATAIVAQRDEIASLAQELGIEPPATLRTAYQTAERSFDAARTFAEKELEDVRALATAEAALDAPRDPIVALGLVGTAPEVDLAAARSAFSSGAADAAARAAAVTAVIGGAAEIGRGRLIAAVAGLLVLLALIVVMIVLFRRRGHGRRAAAMAAASVATNSAVATDSAAALLAEAGPDGAAALLAEAGPDGAPRAGEDPPYATLADQSGGALDGPPDDPEPPVPDPGAGLDRPPADRSDAS